MPQIVSVSGWPSARMLKSITPCVPGQEPVESAVQPGGVSVGKTPIIGRWTPRSNRRFRRGHMAPVDHVAHQFHAGAIHADDDGALGRTAHHLLLEQAAIVRSWQAAPGGWSRRACFTYRVA